MYGLEERALPRRRAGGNLWSMVYTKRGGRDGHIGQRDLLRGREWGGGVVGCCPEEEKFILRLE